MVAVHATSGVFRTWFARELKLGELLFAEPTVVDDGACTIKLVTRPDLAAWFPASVRKHVSNAQQIEFHDELTYERSDDSRTGKRRRTIWFVASIGVEQVEIDVETVTRVELETLMI